MLSVGQKTQKQRKIDDLAEKYAELDKESPKAVKNKLEKDILVRNMVSNLEIDAQKRVIYRYKSPFNFIFEPEFSTGSPVGEPGGARTLDTGLKRPVL